MELFARRVIGLGERSGAWADAHHPAGSDPDAGLSSEYELRRSELANRKDATPEKTKRVRKASRVTLAPAVRSPAG
jgi:hypothetical protein